MSSSAAPTLLNLRHTFGVNSLVSENITYSDNDTITYVAGHSIVQYNKQDRRQRFIQASEIVDSISAFTASANKRLIAVAERGERPQVHIFDLRTYRRKKSFSSADSGGTSREFICLYFSQDDQLMLTMSGSPDWLLCVWNWSKAKLIALVQLCANPLSMYKCSFSPIDNNICCAIGKDYIKFFRIAEKELRVIKENHIDQCNFTAHCWMRAPDDHIVAGTDKGQLMLFRAADYVCQLPCAPGAEYPIWSLISVPGGFIAGSGPGTLFFFAYDDSMDQALFDSQFTLVNKVVCPDHSLGIFMSFAINPNEDCIASVTSDGQILTFPFLGLKSLVPEEVSFAVTSFHGPKSVVGMDVAQRRPLIITCCKDQTLRIWNFQTHSLELLRNFHEDLYSASIHPNGLHIAVGFTDKLRIYHLLVDDIRLCMEVSIKACRESRFGKGGQVLAAANGNSIVVFDFHTGEKLADLRGHNSKVRSLHWLDNGYQLLSCGQDGAIYIWDLDGAKRAGEYVQKGTVFTSAVCSGNSVIAVGSDRMLREFAINDLTALKSQDAGLVLTHVAISASRGVLFAGTSEHGKPGFIRAYAYPLTGEFDEYPCVSSHVSRLRLTLDECFLIVTDEMGCVAVFELHDKQDRYSRMNPTALPELIEVPAWSDEVLVTHAELDDLANTTMELQTKVDELKLHNEYQLKLKEMNYSEKIKEVTDKFVQELEQAKTKLELLKEEREDLEVEYIEKMKLVAGNHQQQVQEIESAFQAQIMELVDAYQQLTRDRDAQVERLEDQRRQLVASHERYVEELIQDFEEKLDGDRQTRLQYEDERAELEKELLENQNQLEDDVDTEIENMRRIFEEKLTTCREATLKYKGENGIMKKKLVVMQRDLEEQKEEINALQHKEKEYHEQIKLIEREVSAHKKEIKARDVSIGEKEKRIYELKKKNQELDKFKFVLDFKIRELKRQIEPRQMEILGMREQIKKMDEELEKYHKSNAALDTMIGQLRENIENMQKEQQEKRIHAKMQESAISSFTSDVQLTIAHILSPPMLKNAVEELVKTHGAIGAVRPRIDADVEEEYNRHKGFLQRSILQLKKGLEDGISEHIHSNNTLMQANMTLIAEINKQREKNRQLKQSVQSDIGRVRSLLQGQSNRGKSGASITDFEGLIEKPTDTGVDPATLLERNRQRLAALRSAIASLQNSQMRPSSRGTLLPPLESHPYMASATSEPALMTQVGEEGISPRVDLSDETLFSRESPGDQQRIESGDGDLRLQTSASSQEEGGNEEANGMDDTVENTGNQQPEEAINLETEGDVSEVVGETEA